MAAYMKIIIIVLAALILANSAGNTYGDDAGQKTLNIYVLARHGLDEDRDIVTYIVGSPPLSIHRDNTVYAYHYDGFSIYSDMYGGYWIKGAGSYDGDNITSDIYMPIIHRLNETVIKYSENKSYIVITNITSESGEKSLGGAEYRKINGTWVRIRNIKPHIIKAYSVRITIEYRGLGEMSVKPYIIIDNKGRLVYGFFLVPKIKLVKTIDAQPHNIMNQNESNREISRRKI